jgi:hypothetical protein
VFFAIDSNETISKQHLHEILYTGHFVKVVRFCLQYLAYRLRARHHKHFSIEQIQSAEQTLIGRVIEVLEDPAAVLEWLQCNTEP